MDVAAGGTHRGTPPVGIFAYPLASPTRIAGAVVDRVFDLLIPQDVAVYDRSIVRHGASVYRPEALEQILRRPLIDLLDQVERFDSVTNDGQYVRAISRVGFGFLNPAGVVRLHNGA